MADLYLVTTEDATGAWFDDPSAWDTLEEARRIFNVLNVKGAAAFVIYECHQVDYREPTKPTP